MGDSNTGGQARLRKAGLRLALERIDRLLQDWSHDGQVSPPDAEAVATQVERSGDKVLEARARLLVAAAGAGLRAPEPALHGLGLALRVFEANLMGRERGQATRLAARLLIDAGHAETALTLLTGPDAEIDPAPGYERPCQGHALRACALQDLGRLDDAAAAARTAIDLLDPVRDSPRVHAQVAGLCAEVLLATRLHGLGIRTHVSMYASTAEAGMPASAAPPLRELKPLRAWLAGPSNEARSLQLLEDVATQPDNHRLLADLNRLAHLAAADFTRAGALVWLRLGTAYRLQGQPRLAVDCLRRAITLGAQAGQEHLPCRAHFELSQVLANQGDYAAAFASQAALQACTVHRLAAPARRWPDGSADLAGARAAGSHAADGPAAHALSRRKPAQHVHHAQSFMAQQLGQRLAVNDVARHCGVSRRTLEIAFRSELKLTVAECLRDLRLQAVKQRLAHTDLPIKRIAHDLGYSSASSLSRDFRRITGLAPAQYRRQVTEG